MNGSKLILFVLSALLLGSCSSYIKRKQCENVNWYQRAYDIALEGRRLDSDNELRACRKVETEINSGELDRGFKAGMAKYCTPETARDKGINGRQLNEDFCESHLLAKMRPEYIKGLRRYCTPDGGYRAGASGADYLNVCEPNEEQSFLPRYRDGRRVYLNTEISNREREINTLERQIVNSERDKNSASRALSFLPSSTKRRVVTVYNPVTKKNEEKTETYEDRDISRRRNALQGRINTANSRITTSRSKQQALRDEISKMRVELGTLR